MRTIGITGPSTFTADLVRTVEEVMGADVLPLYQNTENGLRRWLGHCDGVILGGGKDIHPATYGGHVLNHRGFSGFDYERDKREMFVLAECLRAKRPVLGICRGHQLIGVAAGIQLLTHLAGKVCHSPTAQGVSLGVDEPAHRVDFVKDTGWSEAPHWYVNSFHHQGLKFTKKGPADLVAVATTGSVIELMQGADAPVIGCQWHPEYDWRVNKGSKMVLERFLKFVVAA